MAADAADVTREGAEPDVDGAQRSAPGQGAASLRPRPARSRPRPPGPLRRNLPMMLLVARDRVTSRFRPLLHEHGLTEQQWRILRVIHDSGPLEPREIVLACGISSPSLAGVLARMEGLGLVTRSRLDHDLRRLEIALTTRSRELVAILAPRIDAIYDDIRRRVGNEVIERLEQTLDLLHEALEMRDPDPDPDPPDR